MANSPVSRRSFIKQAPLAAIAASIPALVGVSASPALARAITAHRAAFESFEDNCWRMDRLDPKYPSDTEENNARIYWYANTREENAFADLLNLPVTTMDDVRAKAGYLLNFMQTSGDIQDYHTSMFLASLTEH